MRHLLCAWLLTTILVGNSIAAGVAPKAPEFSGIDHWINSGPLKISDLRGKVVLVDFWAYSCINCIRAMPHVEHLYQAYKDKGLVVIGVHSPEFDFEKSPANVEDAVKRLGITYPVAMDSHLGTWNAWRNQFWPAEYLIDQNGTLIGHQYGEGNYLRMENAIRLLLGMDLLHDSTSAASPPPATSPEMHLGGTHPQYMANRDSIGSGTRRFTAPSILPADRYALTGSWELTDQYARLNGATGELKLRFHASKLHIVASCDDPVILEVWIDGRQQPAITVHESRLYTLFDGPANGEHTLSLRIPHAGLRVYSFTFG